MRKSFLNSHTRSAIHPTSLEGIDITFPLSIHCTYSFYMISIIPEPSAFYCSPPSTARCDTNANRASLETKIEIANTTGYLGLPTK